MSSIYEEFHSAKVVGRAKLLPRFERFYPSLAGGRWYPVADVGQDVHGVFVDPGQQTWRYVSRAHLQIVDDLQ